MSFQNKEINSSSRKSILVPCEEFSGTPLYNSPNLLKNILPDPTCSTYECIKDKLSQPSRTSDMYAFAILCWEILSEKQPFYWMSSEEEVSREVHLGGRPDLKLLPDNTPDEIILLIVDCWTSRKSCKSAEECVVILDNACQQHYNSETSFKQWKESTTKCYDLQ